MRRIPARICLLAAVMGSASRAAPSNPPAEEKAEPRKARVAGAVQKGRTWLEAYLRNGKRFARADGYAMLAGLALRKAGADPAEEPLSLLLADVRRRDISFTYEAGLAAMLLLECAPEGGVGDVDAKTLQQIADRIAARQEVNGSWGYVVGDNLETMPPDLRKLAKPNDNVSTCQYALLGLHAAALGGSRVPREAWERAAGYFTRTQQSEKRYAGGWGYVDRGSKTPWADHNAPYGAMTAIGVSCLSICGAHLPEGHPASAKAAAARAKGLAWIERHYSVSAHPEIGKDRKGADPGSYYHYWMYALERACAFAGTERIKGHDWYAEGCDALLRSQNRDGAWESEVGGVLHEPTEVSTAFAVLFLTRSSRSIAKYRLERDAERAEDAPTEGVTPGPKGPE